MIKFFRIIRQKLVQENRVGKYMLYAVGEIILVIIGILIAVSLNNMNETRSQDGKIQTILRQIQDELTTAIEQSNGVIEDYRRKDSLIYVVINNNLTKADFEDKRNSELMYISTNFNSLGLQNDGFKNLMLKSDVLTEKYDNLISGLEDLYGAKKSQLSYGGNLLNESVNKTINYQQDNFKWFVYSHYQRITTDEQLQYYTHSMHYKNSLVRYSINAMENYVPSLISFRIAAIKYVREIDVLLGKKQDHSFEANGNDYAFWNGKYHYQGDTAQVDNNETGLKLKVNNNDWTEIYPLGKTKFHMNVGTFYGFKRGMKGEIEGLTAKTQMLNFLWDKVKEEN